MGENADVSDVVKHTFTPLTYSTDNLVFNKDYFKACKQVNFCTI